MKKLTPQLKINLQETLEDFKCLLPRYRKLKSNPILLHKFFSRNRNPIFDISINNIFKTDLISENAKKSSHVVRDHYIQRAKAMRIIFQKLDETPEISDADFLKLLLKFCSTLVLTYEEHLQVTNYAKKDKEKYNYEIYDLLGIEIQGLKKVLAGN
jgi:hypothetical protein